MSHIPQRKEKDCLNCGTIVQGRYCHVCGQENVVPKETFWHMVTHFMYDITHFDSKFFETLKDLIFKPGFLSKEYMMGRRARYLHPIKMYVFTSAIFFLLFFSVFSSKNTFRINSSKVTSNVGRLEVLEKIEAGLLRDSTMQKKDSLVIFAQLQKIRQMRDTTMPVTLNDFAYFDEDSTVIDITGAFKKYKTVENYNAAQKQLPDSLKDGWFKQRMSRKEINLNKKYGRNPDEAMAKLGENVLHRLPYMLFVSLPLFAFILQLLYIRRRSFYYADHGVFTIHLYIFSFILLMVVFGLNELCEYTGWGILGWIMGLLFIGLNFYLYKAMRRFYGQRRFKTFVKFLLTAFFSFLMMVILFAMFFFFTAIEL